MVVLNASTEISDVAKHKDCGLFRSMN